MYIRGCDEQKLASSNDLGSMKRSFLNYYNYASFFSTHEQGVGRIPGLINLRGLIFDQNKKFKVSDGGWVQNIFLAYFMT